MNKYLIGILLLSLVLRMIGLAHGYPYILNIDEPALVRSALGIRFNLWIDHFDWPHFNFYLHYIFFEIFIKFRGLISILGVKDYLQNIFPILWNDPFIFYLLSRFLNSLLVVSSVIPLYLLSKKYLGEKFALIGSIIYLMAPLNLNLSKYAVQEPSLLFFLSWTLYFGVNAGLYLKWKDFIKFSVFLGLATGIKYNAGVFGFIPVFVYLLFSNNIASTLKTFFAKILSAGILSVAVFICTTFSIFKYWHIFWSYEPGRGLLWQLFKNVSPLGWNDFNNKLLENFISFKDEIGSAAFMLLMLGILYGVAIFLTLYKSNRTETVKLNFVFSLCALIYFIYTSRYGRSGGHYLIPVYIFIPFISGFFLMFINELLIGKFKKIPIYMMYFGISLLIISGIIKAQMEFTKPKILSEVLKFADSHSEFYKSKVYVTGEDVETANAINNLDFKKYKDDSKIEANDLILSEKYIESNEVTVLKDYSFIKIYVKN